jgi:hypothetical protein
MPLPAQRTTVLLACTMQSLARLYPFLIVLVFGVLLGVLVF